MLNYFQGANKAAPALEGWRSWQHRLHIRINRKKLVDISKLVYQDNLDVDQTTISMTRKLRTYIFCLFYTICWEYISPASSPPQKLCNIKTNDIYMEPTSNIHTWDANISNLVFLCIESYSKLPRCSIPIGKLIHIPYKQCFASICDIFVK